MNINILGYGQMAKQISALLYLLGHNITIWNHKTITLEPLERTIKLINRSLKSDKQGSILACDDLNELKDCLTIEAVIEDLNTKKEVFDVLRFKIKKGNYYTNSSSYAPDEIDSSVGGIHFFNPITAINMIEFYSTNKTFEIIVLLTDLSGIGFDVIDVKPNRGYVGNYILFHEISSAIKLVEKQGYSAETICSVYNKLYDGRDVFSVVDLIGIDVVYKILENLKEVDDSIYLPHCLKTALDSNILGRKNKTSIRSCI